MPSKQIHARAKRNEHRLLKCKNCGCEYIALSPEYTQICVSEDRLFHKAKTKTVVEWWAVCTRKGCGDCYSSLSMEETIEKWNERQSGGRSEVKK